MSQNNVRKNGQNRNHVIWPKLMFVNDRFVLGMRGVLRNTAIHLCTIFFFRTVYSNFGRCQHTFTNINLSKKKKIILYSRPIRFYEHYFGTKKSIILGQSGFTNIILGQKRTLFWTTLYTHIRTTIERNIYTFTLAYLRALKFFILI